MAKLSWEQDAEKALRKVPFFARGLVRRKVEERAYQAGRDRVTLADFKEAEARFQSVMGNRSESELTNLMPVPNKPGVAMVLVEECHNRLSNCPNPLIETEGWRKAVEAWGEKSGWSEKLRGRVKGDLIYHYQRFHVSISGCPNACSRPQIAEAGAIGSAKPVLASDPCTGCGLCETVCPDRAIRLENSRPVFDLAQCLGCVKCRDICPEACIKLTGPGVRVMLAGKLGRHPHLAEVHGSAQSPAELVNRLEATLQDYVAHGREVERFSDYWQRTLKAGREGK